MENGREEEPGVVIQDDLEEEQHGIGQNGPDYYPASDLERKSHNIVSADSSLLEDENHRLKVEIEEKDDEIAGLTQKIEEIRVTNQKIGDNYWRIRKMLSKVRINLETKVPYGKLIEMISEEERIQGKEVGF